jgi:hypothetical protein
MQRHVCVTCLSRKERKTSIHQRDSIARRFTTIDSARCATLLADTDGDVHEVRARARARVCVCACVLVSTTHSRSDAQLSHMLDYDVCDTPLTPTTRALSNDDDALPARPVRKLGVRGSILETIRNLEVFVGAPPPDKRAAAPLPAAAVAKQRPLPARMRAHSRSDCG